MSNPQKLGYHTIGDCWLENKLHVCFVTSDLYYEIATELHSSVLEHHVGYINALFRVQLRGTYKEHIMSNYRIIVMIPARLGSKRIFQKNIRLLNGKPLILYPIDLVKNTGLVDEIWVNTEDEALGRYCETHGAMFHKRPPELANDSATNRDFVYEFLKYHVCDYIIMANTTSPLLREDTFRNFLNHIDKHDYDVTLSVIEEKAETFFKGKPLNFNLTEKLNSQLLEPTFKIVWALTAWKRDTFLNLQENGVNPVFGGKVGTFIIPKDESCDLDTEEDWAIAEGILLSRQNRTKIDYIKIE